MFSGRAPWKMFRLLNRLKQVAFFQDRNEGTPPFTSCNVQAHASGCLRNPRDAQGKPKTEGKAKGKPCETQKPKAQEKSKRKTVPRPARLATFDEAVACNHESHVNPLFRARRWVQKPFPRWAIGEWPPLPSRAPSSRALREIRVLRCVLV